MSCVPSIKKVPLERSGRNGSFFPSLERWALCNCKYHGTSHVFIFSRLEVYDPFFCTKMEVWIYQDVKTRSIVRAVGVNLTMCPQLHPKLRTTADENTVLRKTEYFSKAGSTFCFLLAPVNTTWNVDSGCRLAIYHRFRFLKATFTPPLRAVMDLGTAEGKSHRQPFQS